MHVLGDRESCELIHLSLQYRPGLIQLYENNLPIGATEILSFIEPIRDGVKNSLICKFVMYSFQSLIIIG